MTLRKVLIIIGGVFAFLIVVALVLPSFLDWNQYRGQIENVAEAATGRDVTIAGDISFALLPAPSLTAGKVSIANLPGGTEPEMVLLDALDVRVSLLPLIARRIQVEKIVLVKPVIHLEVLADGRANWNFKSEDTADDSGGGAGNVRLDRFVVDQGRVTYRNAASGFYESASNISMEVSAESMDGPVQAEGAMSFRDVTVVLNLSTGRRTANDRLPVNAALTVADARLGLNGIAAIGAEAGYEGTLSVVAPDAGRLVTALRKLGGRGPAADVQLVQPLAVDLRVKAGPKSLETEGLTLSLGDSRASGDLALDFGDTAEAAVTLAFTMLDADSIIAAIPEPEPDAPVLTVAEYLEMLDPGDLKASIRLTADAIRHRGRIIRQAELNADAADGRLALTKFHALLPGGSDVDLVGVLTGGDSPRFEGRVAAGSNNLRGLLDWLALDVSDVPPARLASFSLASDIALGGSTVELAETVFRLDTMTAQGKASYAFGDPPSATVEASLDRIDVSDYLKAEATCLDFAKSGPASPASGSASAKTGGLSAMNARVKLTVERLNCRPVEGRGVHLDASLNDGTLALSAFRADELLGLAIDSQGRVEGLVDRPRLDLTASVRGASLIAFERAFPDVLPVAARELGPVDLRAVLKGRVEDLAVSAEGQVGGTALNGKGQVKRDSDSGELAGLDLAFGLRNPSLSRFITQWDLGLAPPKPADDRPVALEGTVSGTPQAYEIDISGGLAGAAVTLKGVARTPEDGLSYDLGVTVKGDDARAFVRGLGVQFGEDIEPLGPIDVAARLVGNPNAVSTPSAKGRFGPVRFSGKSETRLDAARPQITGELKTGPVPLDRFMAEDEAAEKQKEWSAEPFDIEWLRTFDASVRIEAENVTTRGYRFDTPKLTLVVKDGRLEVRDLTGRIFDGDATLNFAFGGAPGAVPAMTLGFDIRNASMEEALATAANVRAVTGPVNLKGNFTGTGASPKALVSSITGQTDIGLGQGLVRGIDLPQLSTRMSEIRDVPGLGRLLSAALAGGETAHKGFATAVRSEAGELVMDRLVVELDSAKALFGARVNLPNWSVSSAGRLQLNDHPLVPPIGFDIGGSLSAPAVSFNSQEFQRHMAGEIGRALIERAAGGGLGDLLGRPRPPESEADAPTGEEPAPQAPTEEVPAAPAKRDPAGALFDNILKSIKPGQREGETAPPGDR